MWTVLRSFESEPEARVVEAFLKANQIDVQLLGTHSHSGAVAPGSMKTAAMRLMVRQDQVPSANQLLKEQESRAHLSVVEGPPVKDESRPIRLVIALVFIVLTLTSILVFFR
jgi:hypothetical protein